MPLKNFPTWKFFDFLNFLKKFQMKILKISCLEIFFIFNDQSSHVKWLGHNFLLDIMKSCFSRLLHFKTRIDRQWLLVTNIVNKIDVGQLLIWWQISLCNQKEPRQVMILVADNYLLIWWQNENVGDIIQILFANVSVQKWDFDHNILMTKIVDQVSA